MTKVEIEIMDILASNRGEMYGLEIVKASEKAGGTVRRGTVYVHLGRLEDGGLVISRKEKLVPDDGLARRLYKPTSSGRRALQDSKNVAPGGLSGAPA